VRRSLPAALVLVVGLLLLLDLLVANPSLDAITGGIGEVVVILFAAAALLGAGALVARHARGVMDPDGDRIGSTLVLVGIGIVLVPGLVAPDGAASEIVRWVVGALLVPIGASLLALTAVFVIPAARRGIRLRGRDNAVLLLAAMVTVVLLLPLGGVVGSAMTDAAGWLLRVPVGGVFAGLLVGLALATAVAAARVLFGLGSADE
jgi:hypothetical protein